TDSQTGLMWEQKTSGGGGPRDIGNIYKWSSSASVNVPDGTLFTDFLPQMNCEVSLDGSCPFNGKYRDWPLPTIAQLKTIHACSFSFCIDPIFGPTEPNFYWSSSTSATPWEAWVVFFSGDAVVTSPKYNPRSARAVRGGS